MTEQLVLLDTHCCRHCRRLPDGRCAWLHDKGLDAHLTRCFECRRIA